MANLLDPQENGLFTLSSLEILGHTYRTLIDKGLIDQKDIVDQMTDVVKKMKAEGYLHAAYMPYEIIIDIVLMKPNKRGFVVLRNVTKE